MTSLAVTLTASRIELTDGSGTVTATVTNTSAWDERVVLGAFAAPGAGPTPSADAARWVRIDRPVRDIPSGQTEQFSVTITPDRESAGGTYGLRLIAYSATQAPEENADQARTIEVLVPEPGRPPAPPRRPWWILGVALALIVVIAIVVVVLQRAPGGQPSPPATATPTTQAPTPSATAVLCKPGLVPRLTRPTDLVCVTPAVAKQVIFENDPEVQKARKNDPPGGAYGPETCRQGWVWRDAYDGDTVCVSGQTRDETAQQNRDAAANAGPDASP